MARPSLEERFWAKVDVVHDWQSCWNWTAAKLPKGYGRFGVNYQVVLAHRMSYVLAHGEIPEGMHIDHTCYNPSCVRPIHLRAVTPKQNLENRAGLSRNNKSGYRGVDYVPKDKMWRARVKHQGKTVYCRLFCTVEEAAEAARAARLSLFTHNDADRVA